MLRYAIFVEVIKVKKLLAMVVCTGILLSLTACGEKTGGKTSNPLNDISAADEDAFEYEYDSEYGGMIITDYLKESPKLRIPDTLEGESVVGVNLSKCEKELTHLYFPDSVIRISLSDKTEQTVKYLAMPAAGADYTVMSKFYGEYAPTIEEFYQNNIENTYRGFTDFHSLESISVTEKCPRLATIDGMLFYDYGGEKILLVCPQGKSGSINLPKDTTKIGASAFHNCKKITSIAISESVTEIGAYAFENCESLINLTIPESVTEIGHHAFESCKSLTSVTIPDKVTTLENNIFDGCTSLMDVTYKGKTYNSDNIGELFDTIMHPAMSGGMIIENNTLVKVSENAVTIEIPDTVTEVDEDAFDNTPKLTKIRFKNKTYSRGKSESMKNLYAAVRGEEGLTIVDGVLKKVSPELTEVKIPDRVTKIYQDGYGTYPYTAFKGCNNLKKVTFGNGITDLYGISFIANGSANIFGLECCENLEEIIIPEGVTAIHNAFSGCTKLKNITLPNSLESIGQRAFEGCKSLTNITIPDSVTSIGVHEIFKGYRGDPNLEVEIPGAFEGCENIKAAYKGKTYDYAHIDDLYKAINGN